MDERTLHIRKAADYIRSIIGDRTPEVGIILGSGLGKLGDSIENPTVIPYRDIPDFPVSTAIGHKGNFIIGTISGHTVIAMQGRFHFYEGYPMDKVTIAVRTMKCLGAEYLFVSNAAGTCNPDFHTGDLMVIRDHINMMNNPLIGPNFDDFGPRFLDMTCAYDADMRQLAFDCSSDMGLTLREGVYLAGTGPTYETPSEVRFYRLIGADALGMSTVPEVIVARHCGMKVFGVSVITNECNFDPGSSEFNDGDDVVKKADKAAATLSGLFRNIISRLPQNGSRG